MKNVKNVKLTIPAHLVHNATSAQALGDFNNWTPSDFSKMTLQEDGSLAVTLSLEAGKSYQYRFFLNDGRWLNDPSAQGYEEQATYFTHNSIVFVEAENENKKEEKAPASKKETVKDKKVSTRKATVKKSATKKEVAKDPLEKIKGIDVATRNVLHKAGITTFSKLSKTGQATIKKALADAGEKFAELDSSSWVRDAKKQAAEKAAAIKK